LIKVGGQGRQKEEQKKTEENSIFPWCLGDFVAEKPSLRKIS
jgi:hypothetical protein